MPNSLSPRSAELRPAARTAWLAFSTARSSRWLTLGSCLLAVASLTACASRGGQTGDEFADTRPGGSIDESKIRVTFVDGAVHVTGEDGAVPPRSTVNVTGSGGGSTKTQANAEGGFEAVLPGELSDSYTVGVEGNDAPESVTVAPAQSVQFDASAAPGTMPLPTEVAAEPDGGASPHPTPTAIQADAGGVPESLTMEQASSLFQELVSTVDSCANDGECTLVSLGCPLGCYSYVNSEHEAQVVEYGEALLAAYGGACTYSCQQAPAAACSNGRCGPGASVLSLAEDGETVVPTDEYLACEADADCALVDNSCSSCCTESAVSSSFEAQYAAARDQACEGYQGPICDCDKPAREARCEDALCVVVDL